MYEITLIVITVIVMMFLVLTYPKISKWRNKIVVIVAFIIITGYTGSVCYY